MKETRAKQGKPVGNPCAPSFGVQSRNFGCRWRSSEGNPRETGETRRVRSSKVAWGNPCETRGTRWEPCATLYASFGVETRNFQEVGTPARRRGSCWSPETRLPCSKFCGNPRDTWTVFRTSALALLGSVASWGASLCITLYIVAILAILTFLFVPLFPPSNLLPVLRCPTCDKASCGIRTHDLPLTERVLYQLS